MRTHIAPRTFRRIALAALVPFVVIALWMAVDRASLLRFDARVTEAVVDRRNVAASDLFGAVTRAADPVVGAVIVVLFAGLLFAVHRKPALPLWFLATVSAGTLVINPLLKILVDRPRPDRLVHLITADHASFPSGHSLGSVMIYGGIGYVILHLIDNDREPYWLRPTVIAAAVLLSVVIAFSRVYLGVHFLTDVLAGLSLGSFLLLMSIACYEQRVRSTPVLNTDRRGR